MDQNSQSSTYLGEVPVTIEDSVFKNFTPARWSLEFITLYGQIEGEHHKLWVLDQVASILHGTPVIVKKATWQRGALQQVEYRFSTGEPTEKYLQWVASIREDGYSYEEGVAP